MKITLIAPTYLPARRANSIQVMKMAQALDVLGHEVCVTVPESQPGLPHSGSEREWDTLAHHYGLHRKFSVIWLPANQYFKRYDYAYQAVRYAQQWGADILYTRLPQAATLASITGKPVILEMHDLPHGVGGPWMFRLFIRGRGKRRIVVISQVLANDLALRYKISKQAPFLLVAPDGVDLIRYENLPGVEEARKLLIDLLSKTGQCVLARSIPSQGFIAGYTGHLYPGRGMAMLQSLARQLPQVTFLIVGGEPTQVNKYQTDIALKKIENMVFTGFIPNSDLPLYQAVCNLLLMPYQSQVSASSGGDIARYLSPMKLFEYLACGRAIISSDLPVLKEVLNLNNSIQLPPDDVDAWVNAIRTMIINDTLREKLAAQAKKDAQKYSWEQRAEQIINGIINLSDDKH